MRQLYRNWVAFMIGGMLGVVVMWLMAPMTGEETRRILSENLADAQAKANIMLEDAQEKARQISDIGRRMVEEQKSSLERTAEEIKSVAKGSEDYEEI